jgi:hypothetical protein
MNGIFDLRFGLAISDLGLRLQGEDRGKKESFRVLSMRLCAAHWDINNDRKPFKCVFLMLDQAHFGVVDNF